MTRGKLIVATIVVLMTGFVGAFVLRPVVVPVPETTVAFAQPAPLPASEAARGTQYFIAHVDEARHVITACREGTVRGSECANAETALVTVDSKERFRRFRNDQ